MVTVLKINQYLNCSIKKNYIFNEKVKKYFLKKKVYLVMKFVSFLRKFKRKSFNIVISTFFVNLFFKLKSQFKLTFWYLRFFCRFSQKH